MYESQAVFDELTKEIAPADAKTREPRGPEWNAWAVQADARVSFTSANLRLVFPKEPLATDVGDALGVLDRESRRVVTGLVRGVKPGQLTWRRARLLPRSDGLRVREATAGSLELLVPLGALYSAITSQPLSFALNLAALMSYGRAALRVVVPNGERRSADVKIRSESWQAQFPSDAAIYFEGEASDGAKISFAYVPRPAPPETPRGLD